MHYHRGAAVDGIQQNLVHCLWKITDLQRLRLVFLCT